MLQCNIKFVLLKEVYVSNIFSVLYALMWFQLSKFNKLNSMNSVINLELVTLQHNYIKDDNPIKSPPNLQMTKQFIVTMKQIIYKFTLLYGTQLNLQLNKVKSCPVNKIYLNSYNQVKLKCKLST